MNSAKRLETLLNKIKASKKTKAIELFEEVFEADGCVKVAQKIKLIEKQIERLNDIAHEDTIKYLKDIFNCKLLQRDLKSQINQIQQHTIGLHGIGNVMTPEKIDEKAIAELSDLLVRLESKLDNANLEDYHKEAVKSYIEELRDGLIDINYGGVEAMTSHIEIACGKVVLYNESFRKDKDIYDDIS